MDTITLISPYKTKFSHTLAHENNSTHLHDASFSSNLNSAEPTTGKKTKDGEISIFDAEKYFNGGIDEEKSGITKKGGTKHQPKNDEKIDLKSKKPKIKPGTPSNNSEASWNSQRALLPPIRRNKEKGIRLFTIFSCKCSCSDDKSVDIKETDGKNKSSSNYKKADDYDGVHRKEIAKVPVNIDSDPISLVETKQTQPNSQFKDEILSIGLQREDCFSFPVLNSGVGNMTIEREFKEEKDEEEEEEKARNSLEVFGSPIMDKGDRALSLERRLTMLTWDPNPRVDDIQDIESDSSSDLFEIKSLSSNAQPFFRHRASDGVSSCVTPTTCYEPSEASIEWSVITTIAPDCPAVSDYDECKSDAIVTSPEAVMIRSTTTTKAMKVQKCRPSALLGCRSCEAVRVAGQMPKKAKSDTRRRHRSSDCSTPKLENLQAETMMTDFKFAHGQPTFTTRSLSRSYSARASRSLRIN